MYVVVINIMKSIPRLNSSFDRINYEYTYFIISYWFLEIFKNIIFMSFICHSVLSTYSSKKCEELVIIMSNKVFQHQWCNSLWQYYTHGLSTWQNTRLCKTLIKRNICVICPYPIIQKVPIFYSFLGTF